MRVTLCWKLLIVLRCRMYTFSPFLVGNHLQHFRQRKLGSLRTSDKWGNCCVTRLSEGFTEISVTQMSCPEDPTRLYRQIMNENPSDISHKCFIVAGDGGLLTNKLTGMQQHALLRIILRFIWLTTCHAPCCCSRSQSKMAWLGMHSYRWKCYHWHADIKS